MTFSRPESIGFVAICIGNVSLRDILRRTLALHGQRLLFGWSVLFDVLGGIYPEHLTEMVREIDGCIESHRIHHAGDIPVPFQKHPGSHF
jgi:hypothetical protein